MRPDFWSVAKDAWSHARKFDERRCRACGYNLRGLFAPDDVFRCPECGEDVRRDCLEHFHHDAERWRDVYNHVRPHEALGDLPPISRWRPSLQRRPDTLPPVEYPIGSLLRNVSSGGDIQYRTYRVLVGYGLVGEHVRIEDRDDAITIYYSWMLIRLIAKDQLTKERLL